MIENLAAVQNVQERKYQAQEKQIDMLLFDFLQEIIFYKDSEQLLLLPKDVEIKKEGEKYKITAVFGGEPLNPTKHEQRVDVKAVTLHKFVVAQEENTWTAHVILDI